MTIFNGANEVKFDKALLDMSELHTLLSTYKSTLEDSSKAMVTGHIFNGYNSTTQHGLTLADVYTRLKEYKTSLVDINTNSAAEFEAAHGATWAARLAACATDLTSLLSWFVTNAVPNYTDGDGNVIAKVVTQEHRTAFATQIGNILA